MKALEIIQADDALVAVKRAPDFDREHFKTLSQVDDVDAASPAKMYLSRFLDPYLVDRMSPAAWRVLFIYLMTGR